MSKLWIAQVTRTIVVFTEDDKRPRDSELRRLAQDEPECEVTVREAKSVEDIVRSANWSHDAFVYCEDDVDISLREAASRAFGTEEE